jgi:hypothetical protein
MKNKLLQSLSKPLKLIFCGFITIPYNVESKTFCSQCYCQRYNEKKKTILYLNSIDQLKENEIESVNIIITDSVFNPIDVEYTRSYFINMFSSNRRNNNISNFNNNNFKKSDQLETIRNDFLFWANGTNINDEKVNKIINGMQSLPSKINIKKLSLYCPKFVQVALYNGNNSKYIKHRDNKPKSRVNLDDDFNWFSQPEQRYQ